MKRHGADVLWKGGTHEKNEGEITERWNEGDTGGRIETDIFTYIHTRLTHNCAFTQRPYHTNTLLHTDIIHTNTFTHRDAFTHKTLFDTQTPLHIIKPFAQSPFRHKHFYTQKKYTNMTPAAKHMQELIAKHATSLNSSRDTTLSQAGHTWSLLHTQLLFTHRRLNIQTFFYRITFTQTHFYHKPLYSKTLLHTNTFTKKPFHTLAQNIQKCL